MILVGAKNDALRADGQRATVEAEILNFFLRMVTACVPRLPHRLIVEGGIICSSVHRVIVLALGV